MKRNDWRWPTIGVISLSGIALLAMTPRAVAEPDKAAKKQSIDAAFKPKIQPLLKNFCFKCHSGERTEADIDLGIFRTMADVRKHPKVWLKIRAMINSGQMPPKGAKQLKDGQRLSLRKWVRSFLAAEARAKAGDPGPVVLRRLSNAEYTFTIRDLTGVATLDPAKQFPIDGAAGEGFTNTGSALVMSPSLIQKYLDAAKRVADHAVLLPAGIRFSPSITSRDETDRIIARLQKFYEQYTSHVGGSAVNLQGIKFATNTGGRLPIDKYLAVTIAEKPMLRAGKFKDVADKHGLNAKYLRTLWDALTTGQPSALIAELRQRWAKASLKNVPALAAFVSNWQKALWKFNTIGHIGREGGPKSWLEAVSPIANTRSFNQKLPISSAGKDVVVFLSANSAGDGNANDYVVWKNPRLIGGGRPALPLRYVVSLQQELNRMRRKMLTQTTHYLAAVAETKQGSDLRRIAAKHGIDHLVLSEWLDYMGINASGRVVVTGHFKKTMLNGTYKFIQGWGTGATPLVIANSSDRQVRVPGIAAPRTVMVHPSPTLYAAVGWHSPVSGDVRITANIADVHPECGNGVEWVLQHRTKDRVATVWQGEISTAKKAKLQPKTISVRRGELLEFIVGPRGREHTCDLTRVNLVVTETGGKKRVWDLAKDVSGSILASNPHEDRHGNAKIWHFYKGPMTSINKKGPQLKARVPAKSLLARWLTEKKPDQKRKLALQVQALATGKPPKGRATPNALLYGHLQNMMVSVNQTELLKRVKSDPRFGKHPLGHAVAPDDLVVKAPATIAIRIPSQLATGRAIQAIGQLDAKHGREGSVQLAVGTAPAAIDSLQLNSPIIATKGSQASKRVLAAMDDFRNLFPAAVCYTRIVPVDEVVTLTLFFREDDQLQRLMLSREEVAQLNRLWDELYYVSHEPLKLVVAFEQISEFATQDRPDLVKAFKIMKKPINDRAAAFRRRLVTTQPRHVASVLEFSGRAWRRPLTSIEKQKLRSFYALLRKNGVAHGKAVRLMLARVLTSPSFLYRLEKPGSDRRATPVSNSELANRLSYFLWSSLPDRQLRRVADAGKLAKTSDLLKQTRRMLKGAKTRRLAIQFACQWLHIRDFDRTAEKNEKRYPQFAQLRSDMYQESVRFFTDMFQNDRSILSMLNADHAFLNEQLAKHYGISGITGKQLRRVDGVSSKGRGGILAMATVLASQSGASRTSPILRGNWVFETLLGEKLPKPPAKVPQLPESVPSGLTARQLIERHSSVPACAKCHSKIDGYGFSLEQYDAIGRRRPKTVATKTKLPDGKTIEGLNGLRNYLAKDRREDVVRQFCRKLLGYALGREVQLSDEPLLDEMWKKLQANNYRFSIAVNAIVTSRQFREIRGKLATP